MVLGVDGCCDVVARRGGADDVDFGGGVLRGGGRETATASGGGGHEASLCVVRDVADKLTDSATYRACLMETNRRVICFADTDCVCVGEVRKSSRKFKTRIGRKLPLIDDRKYSQADKGTPSKTSEEEKTNLENFKFEKITPFAKKKE